MVRILTKQLVDGKEVNFQIAHQPRNIIDCDIESEEDDNPLEAVGGLLNEIAAAVNNEEEEKKSAEEKSSEDSEEENSFNEAIDDVNEASSQIKSAIKYKLINNLFKEYLGYDLPFNPNLYA